MVTKRMQETYNITGELTITASNAAKIEEIVEFLQKSGFDNVTYNPGKERFTGTYKSYVWSFNLKREPRAP